MQVKDPVTGEFRTIPNQTAIDPSWFKIQARQAGLDPAVVAAIINQESRWKPFSNIAPTIAWNQHIFNKLAIEAGSYISPVIQPLLATVDNTAVSSVVNSKAMIKKAANVAADSVVLPVSLTKSSFDKIQSLMWRSFLSHAKAVTDGMAHALPATAVGLGQILLSNYKMMGHDSPLAMYLASWDPKEQVRHALTFLKQPAIAPLLSWKSLTGHLTETSLVVSADLTLTKMESIARFYAGPQWREYYPEWPAQIFDYAKRYRQLGY